MGSFPEYRFENTLENSLLRKAHEEVLECTQRFFLK